MKIHLANNLQYLREEKKKKSQPKVCADISEKLGITLKKTTYSHWEVGRAEPSLTMLWYLASYYEVSVEDLLYKDLEGINH